MQDAVTQRFIDTFEKLRELNKVSSQKEFADLMGFPEQYFSGLRAGSRKAGSKLINKLVMLFGVSLHYLMTGQGAMFSEEGKATQHAHAGRDIGIQAGRDVTQGHGSDCEQKLAAALREIELLRERIKDKEQLIELLMRR
jgi:transcriptional regulator with XRE-family HTH domain